MAYLEELMVAVDYDLRAYQSILYKTRAYQREASLEEPVPGAPYHFAGPVLRRISAEQIWDSLVAMTVPEPDKPDAGRELYAKRRIATVQLIAEAIYDQKPAQFLNNVKEVVAIQKELSAEIDAATEAVAKARELDDPDLIKEAVKEASRIRKELGNKIEEVVYRDGLSRKIADQLEPASLAGTDRVGSNDAEAASTAAEANALMDELTATLLRGDRTFEEGMEDIAGSNDGDGIIDELITAMFRDQSAELKRLRAESYDQDRIDWKVESKDDQKAYRTFNESIRDKMLRASDLTSPAPGGHFLREFGQSDRELVENSSDQAAVTQSLALLNGPALSAITNRYSVLSRDMRGEKFEDRLDTIYLTMLNRRPLDEERRIFKKAWQTEPESGSTSGIVWTLLNTREFLFIQ